MTEAHSSMSLSPRTRSSSNTREGSRAPVLPRVRWWRPAAYRAALTEALSARAANMLRGARCVAWAAPAATCAAWQWSVASCVRVECAPSLAPATDCKQAAALWIAKLRKQAVGLLVLLGADELAPREPETLFWEAVRDHLQSAPAAARPLELAWVRVWADGDDQSESDRVGPQSSAGGTHLVVSETAARADAFNAACERKQSSGTDTTSTAWRARAWTSKSVPPADAAAAAAADEAPRLVVGSRVCLLHDTQVPQRPGEPALSLSASSQSRLWVPLGTCGTVVAALSLPASSSSEHADGRDGKETDYPVVQFDCPPRSHERGLTSFLLPDTTTTAGTHSFPLALAWAIPRAALDAWCVRRTLYTHAASVKIQPEDGDGD